MFIATTGLPFHTMEWFKNFAPVVESSLRDTKAHRNYADSKAHGKGARNFSPLSRSGEPVFDKALK